VELKAYDESGTLLDSTTVQSGYLNTVYAEVEGVGIKYVVFEDSANYWGMDDLIYSFSGGYIKPYMEITLEAEDMPDNICKSGLQAIFWRYEYQGNEYPEYMDTHGYPIVTGAELAATYGYDDPNYIGHCWYRIDSYPAIIYFMEECQHDIFYWAKDNVWNNEVIHYQTYFVDDTPPVVYTDYGEPSCCETPTSACVTTDTPIWINASDPGGVPECQAGVESIFFRFKDDSNLWIPIWTKLPRNLQQHVVQMG
jgi:hypothetical protein